MQLRSGILIHLALPSTDFVGPLATDSKPEVFTVDVKSGKAFEQGIDRIGHPALFLLDELLPAGRFRNKKSHNTPQLDLELPYSSLQRQMHHDRDAFQKYLQCFYHLDES